MNPHVMAALVGFGLGMRILLGPPRPTRDVTPAAGTALARLSPADRAKLWAHASAPTSARKH
jgi:hypothetical protein